MSRQTDMQQIWFMGQPNQANVMGDDESAPMSIAQRIAALNIQAESSPAQPAAAAIKPRAKTNALTGRIAALQRNAASATNADAKNEDDAGDGGGGGGGAHPKTEKPKVGRLKPPPAGMAPFGSGPPPSTLLRKQRERKERMERLQREAKSTEEESEEPASEAEGTMPAVVNSKLPVGVVPAMLPFRAGLPPILLKKQREREERMEGMKREVRPMDDNEGGVVDAASPTPDENFDAVLLSRPIVKGGKRRPKTRD
jgi:hypothetical protein